MASAGKKGAPRGGRRPSKKRLQKLLETEYGFWSRDLTAIAGVDEAGRGPLAGPVVAAAVILPVDCLIEGADDSKRLTPAQRLEIAERIAQQAISVRIGAASAREIDRINILRASALAMRRAVMKLDPQPDHLLVDGLPVAELGAERHTAIVGGDALVHCIACASIIAKVCRDRLMQRLALRYPVYGWEQNMGYGTPQHRAALERHGPTPHHRRSFQPVQQFTLELPAL